jgi:23S rRNA pseudouridine2605 synthase
MAKPDDKKSGRKKYGDYSKFFKEKKAPVRKSVKKSNAKEKTRSRTNPTTATFGKDGTMRLNKYIAHAGVCSRREADTLIEAGEIKVNGKTVTELGYKINRKDKVTMKGKLLRAEKLQYILLNKPRGFITTTDDPYERKTVMSLVERACDERIYPVGRLDKETTGLLLFTNDGELAKKLTHPKHRIRKMYHVVLDKDLTKNDMKTLVEGMELDDGLISADKAGYVEGKGKNEVGIELHSGKNRIVRRMFEHLGYNVRRLDRVVFAGLTKKDLPRGRWRYLTEKEINFLKML